MCDMMRAGPAPAMMDRAGASGGSILQNNEGKVPRLPFHCSSNTPGGTGPYGPVGAAPQSSLSTGSDLSGGAQC